MKNALLSVLCLFVATAVAARLVGGCGGVLAFTRLLSAESPPSL